MVFTTFTVKDNVGNEFAGTIGVGTVGITVPFNTATTLLVFFTTDVEGTILVNSEEFLSGNTLDLSSPINFDLAGDITIVTLTVAENTESQIKSFKINGAVGAIRNDTYTVILELTEGIDVTNLIPEIEISENATILPASEVETDFTIPVVYTVTAENTTYFTAYDVTVALAPDHVTQLYIYKMVLNRLPFIVDNSLNKELLSNRTFEIMFALENCFKIGAEDTSKIGLERYYSILQRSAIADIICVETLLFKAAEVAGGNGISAATNIFIKEAQAGSAKVVYDQLKVNEAGFGMNVGNLMRNFRNSANTKLSTLGCAVMVDENGNLITEDSPIPYTITNFQWGN